ncbi:MAG: phosphoribosylamine--glycine ligase [Acidimicrobiia bacterium]
MKVLLLGSGGREHAIGWKLSQSPRVQELISLPGNPGLAELGPVVEGVGPTDIGAMAAMAKVQGVDLVVVGPEAPLAAGVVDAMSDLGVPVFGPTRSAARLESSKAFAKDVMKRAGVATAASESFVHPDSAKEYLDRMDGPFVVKADGLAAGKGVLVTDSRVDAASWVEHCLGGGFGEAGSSVLIEDYLEGPEVSVFAVCTEAGAVALEPARDYKRLLENDEGPNTGGMGAYSPVDDLPEDLVQSTMRDVIHPTLDEMATRGDPFTGFLYAGLVLTDQGAKVLEFNVRLGDPETQVVLPRMETDLVDVLEGAEPQWSPFATVNVVLAAQGYPTAPETGVPIEGLDRVPSDVLVFHAGTRSDNGVLRVGGGRVLNVVGKGNTLALARERAYIAAQAITWPGMEIRADIGA